VLLGELGLRARDLDSFEVPLQEKRRALSGWAFKKPLVLANAAWIIGIFCSVTLTSSFRPACCAFKVVGEVKMPA
jgi:hypothetical protein